MDKNVALIKLNFLNASTQYSEHVGVNLQLVPSKGEIVYLYILNKISIINTTILFTT